MVKEHRYQFPVSHEPEIVAERPRPDPCGQQTV
jgi:hypothetical protein